MKPSPHANLSPWPARPARTSAVVRVRH